VSLFATGWNFFEKMVVLRSFLLLVLLLTLFVITFYVIKFITLFVITFYVIKFITLFVITFFVILIFYYKFVQNIDIIQKFYNNGNSFYIRKNSNREKFHR
jgi:hypothetical protein